MDVAVSTQTSTGLDAVRHEIERACRDASRDPKSVTLVAVSKTFAADAIAPKDEVLFPALVMVPLKWLM